MRYLKYKISLLLLLISAALYGQDRVLLIEECRQMAIESNYNLKSSSEKISISEDILAVYKANRLPNLSANANYLYSTSSSSLTIPGGYLPIFTEGVMSSTSFAYMPDIDFEFEIGSIYNVGALITQPIYMGGKINNAIKLASIGVDVSRIDRQKSQAEVLEATDKAFYTLLEVMEQLESAKKYKIVLEEFNRQMTNGYEHGMKSRNDLLKVGVKLNEAKLMVEKATNGLRLAKMNLCYMVGLPLSESDFTVSDPFILKGEVDSENLDITSRPEYAMLEKQIAAKELEVKISRSALAPSVSALASYSYMNGASLNDNTLINGLSLNGGVMVSIPIFHWGEAKRKVSAKRREVTIAQNQMEDLSQQMRLELLQAINNYNESILQVELTRDALAQSEENMRMSENEYSAGMETIAYLLEAQALWQAAMSNHNSAKSLQRMSYSKYLRCRGELSLH